jgi:hypothetical protein
MLTDAVSAFGAVYLLWEHYLIVGVCVAFIPSTVLSMVLIAKVDLEKYKNSALGVYVRKHMSSKALDWLRFAGLMIMMVGGWNRWLWLVGVGLSVVLFVWMKGLLPQRSVSKEKQGQP